VYDERAQELQDRFHAPAPIANASEITRPGGHASRNGKTKEIARSILRQDDHRIIAPASGWFRVVFGLASTADASSSAASQLLFACSAAVVCAALLLDAWEFVGFDVVYT
jgi:hypothetical protein